MKKILLLSALYLIFLPSAEAVDFYTQVGSVSDFGEYLTNVWSWASQVIFGVAVLATVVGGILLMTSDGNEEKTDMGRNTIKGAVISIVIVLFSAVLQKFLSKPSEGIDGNISETSVVINNSINLLLGLVGVLAIVGFVTAGFRYITSGGDEEKMDKAKRGLRLSLIGAVVSIAAWSLLQFLLNIWA